MCVPPEIVEGYYQSHFQATLRPTADGWVTVKSPFRDDHNASFSVNLQHGGWRDHGTDESGSIFDFEMKLTGCDFKTAKARILVEQKPPAKAAQGATSATVELLAKAKKLPIHFLRNDMGLKDESRGVRIPYRLIDGSSAPRQRIRAFMEHVKTEREKWCYWTRGPGEIVPYGLWRLDEAGKAGYVILEEGESDWWTLCFHGFPALGIPGDEMVHVLKTEYLTGISKAYVFREPGDSGETFVPKMMLQLQKIGWKGQTRIVSLDSVKDPSELHCADPAEFKVKFQAALEAAHEAPKCSELKANGARPGSEHDDLYFVEEGRICFRKKTADGGVTIPLCNFNAWVAEEITLDDGRETRRMFQVEGELCSGEQLAPVRVSSNEFSSMRWPTANWGIRARVSAGFGAQDKLREAIQAFSTAAKQRRVFTHTGWAKVDGEPVFLSCSGAIGRTDIEVELPSDLWAYSLPQRPEGVREAMELSFRLLEIAPLRITAPLLAGVFRAPLASALPVDVSLFVQGKTGTQKSTVTALFLSHFGNFERLSLPGSFSSTANWLEHTAFLLKDVPFVVDDFVPSPLEAREMETKLRRLVRAQGNRSGRGRLRSDLTEAPTHPPRGLIIVTGEQCPSGQSILARTLVQRFEPRDVKLARLSELQMLSHRLPHVMAGYLTWLAPQLEKMPDLLRDTFIGARERASKGASHMRVPEAVANLWVGLSCALQFAEEIKAIPHTDAERISGQCWEALLAVGREQSLLIEGESPVRRFLEVLATLLTQGRAVILAKESKSEPPDRADLMGWEDSDSLYLLPDAAYNAVSEFCREGSSPFSTGKDTLFRQLKHDGVSDCEGDRTVKMVRIGKSKPRRLLVLRRDKAEELAGQPFPGCVSDVSSVSSFPGMREG